MRNSDLPNLLLAIAASEQAKADKHDVIFTQAAIELKKLDAISAITNDGLVRAILNDELTVM